MVIELSGVQFGLKSYERIQITSMISDMNSIVTFLHPFLNRSFFLICIGPQGWFVKRGNRKRVYMCMPTKQNDRRHFTKTHWSVKETSVNFIHSKVQAVLKSCYCKNGLLQSLILVV